MMSANIYDTTNVWLLTESVSTREIHSKAEASMFSQLFVGLPMWQRQGPKQDTQGYRLTWTESSGKLTVDTNRPVEMILPGIRCSMIFPLSMLLSSWLRVEAPLHASVPGLASTTIGDASPSTSICSICSGNRRKFRSTVFKLSVLP